MLSEKLYAKRLLWLILFATAFRLVYVNLIDLIPDEAYYWDLSRHHTLSYFDHPPLQMYIISISARMLGNTEFAVRLPSVINSGIITFVIYLIGKELFDARTGLYASVLFSIAPVYAAGSILATVDPPFAVFWTLALYCAVRAIKTEKGYWWYLLGASVGLGLTGKYIMLLFMPALVIFLLLSGSHRFWLKRTEPYIGAALALLLFSPVIVWNSQNNWASFRFQLTHGFIDKKISPAASLLQYLGSQSLVVSPLLFIASLLAVAYGIFLWLRNKDWRYLFLVSMSSFVLVFFAYSSLRAKVEGNWPMSAYLSIFVLLPSIYFQTGFAYRRALAALILGSAIVFTSAAFVQALYPVIPLKSDITDQFHGWKDLGLELEQVLTDLRRDNPKDLIVLTDSRQLTSELSFYVPSRPKVYKLPFDGKFDEYNLLEAPARGLNAVIITSRPDEKNPYLDPLFRGITEIRTLELKRGHKVLRVYHLYFGRDFQGFKSGKTF